MGKYKDTTQRWRFDETKWTDDAVADMFSILQASSDCGVSKLEGLIECMRRIDAETNKEKVRGAIEVFNYSPSGVTREAYNLVRAVNDPVSPARSGELLWPVLEIYAENDEPAKREARLSEHLYYSCTADEQKEICWWLKKWAGLSIMGMRERFGEFRSREKAAEKAKREEERELCLLDINPEIELRKFATALVALKRTADVPAELALWKAVRDLAVREVERREVAKA